MANIQWLGTSWVIYTATGKEVISSIAVCNPSASSTTYIIYIVPSGWSAGTTNKFCDTVTISWYDTHTFTLGITPASWTTFEVSSVSWSVNFFIRWQT